MNGPTLTKDFILKKIRNDIRLKSTAMQWKYWLSEYNKRIELGTEKNMPHVSNRDFKKQSF